MRLRYSTRSMLAVSAVLFCILVFHRYVAELIVYGYWLLAIATFWVSVRYARRTYSRSVYLPVLASAPVILVLLYSSYSLVWVADNEKAEWLFQLPAVGPILDYVDHFWYSLNGFWRRVSGDTTSTYYRAEHLETQFTLAILGIIFSGLLGSLAGKITASTIRPELKT